ncbi:hypothetical protein Acr_06g0001610 [Actinidia rufa]|uniref:Uncharacterized protein n=1 Tax=Actinidia rufa TaxID=165716 RepID=A0A7J0EP03_9ERIC|nr:hypothetical protein Acr_06g0001610 [Actinidia rufa]
MKHRSSEHHAKHQHRIDTAENNPVCASTPKPHKNVRMADYDQRVTNIRNIAMRKTLMPKLKSLSNMSIKKFELSKWMSMNGG